MINRRSFLQNAGIYGGLLTLSGIEPRDECQDIYNKVKNKIQHRFHNDAEFHTKTFKDAQSAKVFCKYKIRKNDKSNCVYFVRPNWGDSNIELRSSGNIMLIEHTVGNKDFIEDIVNSMLKKYYDFRSIAKQHLSEQDFGAYYFCLTNFYINSANNMCYKYGILANSSKVILCN